MIGKDITRFHCIYWPAFLMSAGVELPRSVWAHGFVSYGGRRLSKSEGVSFDLDQAIEQHGPEPLRYYLLREIPWNGDGDVTRERFDERYTAELANDLGNLVNRTLAMIERYRGGLVPAGRETSLDHLAARTVGDYREAMDRSLLHRGVQVIRHLTSAANGFIERRAPWALAKDAGKSAELDDVLASLASTLATLSALLAPFLPRKMEELSGKFGTRRPTASPFLGIRQDEGPPCIQGRTPLPPDRSPRILKPVQSSAAPLRSAPPRLS